MPNPHINTHAIQNLLQQCSALRQSGQREMKIGRKQADDLEHTLAIIMTSLVEAQQEIIELQSRVLNAETIEVELDGGEFD